MADLHQGDDNGHGAPVVVDESGVSNSSIVGWGIGVAFVFFGTIAGLSSVFSHYTDNHVRERILSAPSPELQQLRAMEENNLTTYGYVGKDKQVAHLPIAEGMKKVIEEAKK